MSQHNRSSFFDILKNYAPNYEPKKFEPTDKKPKQSTHEPNEKGDGSNRDTTKKKEADQQQKSTVKKRQAHHARNFEREKTQELDRQKREKSLQFYEKWQIAKQNVKEEETDRLKEKIYLQLQLIRCQELAYQNKVKEREEEISKEREKQKAERRAQNEALQELCRQSLAEDRKRKIQKKSRTRTKSNATTGLAFNTSEEISPVATKLHDDKEIMQKTSDDEHKPQVGASRYIDDPPSRLPTKVLLEDSEDEKDLPTVSPSVYEKARREGTDISSVASLTYTPTPGKQSPVTREVTTNITREITRASTLPEEEEVDDEQEVDEFAEYPWYQQQLYRLYGRKQADVFLYPKVEAEAKKTTKPLDPKFKNPDGRTGANELWTNLRKESKGKISKVDASIPEELKVTFNCLARESVSKLRRPIRRSYTVKDDGEELEQLLDQSIVENAQNYRHRMELMYRSSQKNEDRFQVLSFNNPLPNLNNERGDESVSRYIASWEEVDYDADSEPGYKKHLARKQQSPASSRPESLNVPQDDRELIESSSDVVPSDWDFMFMKKPAIQRRDQVKYLFLTERAAETPGQFRRKHQEAIARKNLPQPYQQAPLDGSQSAHYPSVGGTMEPSMTLNAPSPSAYKSGNSAYAVSTEFTLSGDMIPATNQSQPRSKRAHSTIGIGAAKDFPLWEPLSMHALSEYKTKKEILGSGDYAQGKAPTWNRSTAAAVS